MTSEIESPQQKKGISTSLLRELKFPLVFFGLCLLITEATFGAVLIRGVVTERVAMLFGVIMGTLFLTTIGVVAFLTYHTPDHLMLSEQGHLDPARLAKTTEQLRRINSGQGAIWAPPAELESVLEEIRSLVDPQGGHSGGSGVGTR